MNLGDIREAIAANLETVLDVHISPWMLDNPTPPVLHLFPGPTEYDLAGSRGLDMQTITVQAAMPYVSDRGSQETMDELINGSGARSVKAAIEAAPTLGGACSDLRVTECTGYRTATLQGATVLVAEWTVEVYGPGE